MKKMILILVATFASTILLRAQETHFGIKAGLNSSWVNVEDGDDLDSKLGLHAGVLAHIHVNRHFAVQPEMVFSMQGGEAGENKLKLNYLNFPVLAQYMFDQGFRLQTGPQLGFLVAAERKIGDVEVDTDDEFNTLDFGWTFGAGYLFPGKGIGIDARFNLGISDISETTSYEARNNVFQLGLFYQFMNNTSGRRK